MAVTDAEMQVIKEWGRELSSLGSKNIVLAHGEVTGEFYGFIASAASAFATFEVDGVDAKAEYGLDEPVAVSSPFFVTIGTRITTVEFSAGGGIFYKERPL